MRTLIFVLAFCRPVLQARADDATPTPANVVLLRATGRDREAPPILYGSRKIAPFIFEFSDHRVTTIDEFKAAILALPQRTELRWYGADCVSYRDLPLSGPVTAITDLQAFCAAHGVIFTYVPGGY